ncbi:MAG: hypothetical protein K5767_01960 [Clostridia bacterium]|nr:hypothetical protein [Clostridia bacterium]
MRTELQANVLSESTVKKALLPSMVYALVLSMTFMVDTIVAGHFLGTDAVAAVGLGLPVIGLMLSFTVMLLQGGFLKMVNAMGRNDMADYKRLFSLALLSAMIVDLIFLALCLFWTDGLLMVAGAAKATPAAVALGKLYIRTACLEIVFFCMATLFQLVMFSYGYQYNVMLCSLICVVTNITASVIFVSVLPPDLGIAGLGIGSTVATFIQLMSAIFMMKRKKIRVSFGFYRPDRRNIKDVLDMMRRGFPSSADNMLDSVCASIVNRIILASFSDGTAVLALFVILKTVFNIVRTVGRGVYLTCEPLVGILDGGRDNEGIKKTFLTGLKSGIVCAAALAAVIIIFRKPLLAFYNLAGNGDAATGLVLIALSGIVLVVPYALNGVYEPTGRLLLSIVVSSVPDSILFPLLIPLAAGIMGITGIWIIMGYNFVLFFLVYYLIFVIINRKFPVPLDRLLVLKSTGKRVTELDVSVPADAENVTYISEKLQNFLRGNDVAGSIAYKAALCTEEIAADYIAHRKENGTAEKKQKPAYMDIKVFREEGQIEIVIRNYDEPYNPLVFEQDSENFSKIGVIAVQKICRKINYSYAYHLNIVTIVMDSPGK